MAITPIDLLKLADDRDPQLLTAQNFALDQAMKVARRFVPPDPLGLIALAIEAAREIELTATQSYELEAAISTSHTLAVGVLETVRTEEVWNSELAGEDLRPDIGDWGQLVNVIARPSRSGDYNVAGHIASRTFSLFEGRQRRQAARAALDELHELEAWSAAVIYVLLKGPYELGNDAGPIDELSYVPSLGASFEHADRMRGEVENLVGQLHRVAQDEATPDELSTMMTEHARDGHRLFFGSDGAEREIPPMPALVQGWVTGTLDLLSRETELTPEAEELVDDLVADPSPSGFRDALNAQLRDADIPEVAALRSEAGADLIGSEFVGIAAVRLGEALDELLTPDKVAAATGIGWWLADNYHLGPGSYLLSTIIVLALLMRRRGSPGDDVDDDGE